MRRALLAVALLVLLFAGAVATVHYTCAFPYSRYWLVDKAGADRCCSLHTC